MFRAFGFSRSATLGRVTPLLVCTCGYLFVLVSYYAPLGDERI